MCCPSAVRVRHPTQGRDVKQEVGFGGGCHWCTEAVFQALRGVQEVEQGFILACQSRPVSDTITLDYDKT